MPPFKLALRPIQLVLRHSRNPSGSKFLIFPGSSWPSDLRLDLRPLQLAFRPLQLALRALRLGPRTLRLALHTPMAAPDA